MNEGLRTETPLGLRWVGILLRLALLLQALGMLATVYAGRPTHVQNYLFMHLLYHAADPFLYALWFERITVSVYAALALLVWFRPTWPPLLLCAAYALAEPVAGTLLGGFRHYEWSVLTQALRWGTPLALLLLSTAPRSGSLLLGPCPSLSWWRQRSAVLLLGLLVAAVFASHGYLAWLHYPRFIDLLMGSLTHTLSYTLSEGSAKNLLLLIALQDALLALAVLLLPWCCWCRPEARWPRLAVVVVMCWLALWGLLTAGSRVLSLGLPVGISEYPELLLRASHVLAPLAWGLLLLAGRRSSSPAPELSREATGRGEVF